MAVYLNNKFPVSFRGPILLMWINFNISMDK